MDFGAIKASRLQPVKSFSGVRTATARLHSDGHSDDLDGDEDSKVCFPCPFCYVEIDIHDLCNHLQDEHCFDLKNAVCPLCAAILGRDATRHFMVQHACSLRRRRKSQKTGSWHVDTTTLGKELSSFLGSSTDGRGNPLQSASDPLLSPFLCSLPASDTKVDQGNNYDKVPAASNLKSTEATMQADGQNAEERRQRAAFIRELMFSTIFRGFY